MNDVGRFVAARMNWARIEAGMTPEQFARELERIAPHGDPDVSPVSGDYVRAVESGEMSLLAVHLVAAARVLDQPVSVVLGEIPAILTTLRDLESRVLGLEEVAQHRRAARSAGEQPG